MADEYSREQRLRKQAEIQSLYTNLSNLREREASYIQFSTIIPEQVKNQITETRQKIQTTETELVALGDQTFDTPARQFYRAGLQAEFAGNFEEALKLYKNAARHDHTDANAAQRSLRYRLKVQGKKAMSRAAGTWTADRPSRTIFWIGTAIVIIFALLVLFVLGQGFGPESPSAAAVEFTSTPTSTEVIIIPSTATPTPTLTPTPTSTATPSPTNTPEPTATEISITNTPVPTPTLRPAPKIVGPKDELVWKDGAVVFEFEDARLAFNQLYCLNSMKGYNKTNTENWSHPVIGRKKPSIPIEASVFQIAKAQGIECITWSASIGVETCDNIISENSPTRVIGLPRVCKIEQLNLP